MKIIYLLTLFCCLYSEARQETTGQKFGPVVLVNRVCFENEQYNQPQVGCAFLLKYQNDTFAVTARHLLQAIHPPEMKTMVFENMVRKWTLFRPGSETGTVITHKLINENGAQLLSDQNTYDNDFLVFSIDQNRSFVKPLEPRLTPPEPGEKLYVVGWAGDSNKGTQRVYEFEYYKSIGQRMLFKERTPPEMFAGLGGAPVVDGDGLLVGLVSNTSVDPVTGIKFFSACSIENLLEALKTEKKE